MQIQLGEIQRCGLADPQPAPGDLSIMYLAGFAGRQLEHVGRAALGKYKLRAMQYAQDQPPYNVFAFSRGMQVAVQQGLVKFACGRPDRRRQAPGSLVVPLGGLVGDLFVFGRCELRIPRKRQVKKQGFILTAACCPFGRRDSQKAGYLIHFLALDAIQREQV